MLPSSKFNLNNKSLTKMNERKTKLINILTDGSSFVLFLTKKFMLQKNVLKLDFNNKKKSIKIHYHLSVVLSTHIFFSFCHLTFQPVVVVHDVMCPSNPQKKIFHIRLCGDIQT